MTLEQLKQYRAWRISLQSMRAELKQRHSELLQMENTGVLAQNEQARQRLYALEAQLVQSYLEKEAATREVEQWIAQLPGFKEAIFRLRYLDWACPGSRWRSARDTAKSRYFGYSEERWRRTDNARPRPTRPPSTLARRFFFLGKKREQTFLFVRHRTRGHGMITMREGERPDE